jgi:peroxiredoxin Q/BCP
MKMKFKIWTLSLFLFMTCATQAQKANYNVGDIMKNFSLTSDNGKTWESKKVMGKKNLVIYFYPGAMTGGCTKQACAYRDSKDQFSSQETEVIGISGDSAKNLDLFKRAHNLNFTLLSDPDGSIAAEFGVPVRHGQKSIIREIDGVQYSLSRSITTARWTFIIDKNGKVAYISTDVKAAEDSKTVLEVLKKLN